VAGHTDTQFNLTFSVTIRLRKETTPSHHSTVRRRDEKEVM
jgi:hypothetical protein